MKLILLVVLFEAMANAANMCQMQPAYPPLANNTIGWAVVDLDMDPQDSWTAIVQPLTAQIKNLISVVTQFVPPEFLQKVLTHCDNNSPQEFLDRFPAPYGDEISGIATATGIPVCEIILYNIFYEVTGLYTSIVVQNTDGHIYHGRNLDFGVSPAWDKKNNTWLMTEALRPLLVNINFQSQEKTAFMTTQYAGYVGVLTAVRPGAFSLTVDSRFNADLDEYLVKWLFNKQDTANWLAFSTRTVMENYEDYASAVSALSNMVMIGPSYIIMGGVNPGEGCVITNAPNQTQALNVWSIPEGRPIGKPWYVIETNYDHWLPPPKFDNRRQPAEDCLAEVGQDNIDLPTLYNVLHGIPNRNKLTTYTALMDVAAGTLSSSLQWCWEADCPLI